MSICRSIAIGGVHTIGSKGVESLLVDTCYRRLEDVECVLRPEFDVVGVMWFIIKIVLSRDVFDIRIIIHIVVRIDIIIWIGVFFVHFHTKAETIASVGNYGIGK